MFERNNTAEHTARKSCEACGKPAALSLQRPDTIPGCDSSSSGRDDTSGRRPNAEEERRQGDPGRAQLAMRRPTAAELQCCIGRSTAGAARQRTERNAFGQAVATNGAQQPAAVIIPTSAPASLGLEDKRKIHPEAGKKRQKGTTAQAHEYSVLSPRVESCWLCRKCRRMSSGRTHCQRASAAHDSAPAEGDCGQHRVSSTPSVPKPFPDELRTHGGR